MIGPLSFQDYKDYLPDLTQHVPPRGLRLIRLYGLYASLTKGRWETLP